MPIGIQCPLCQHPFSIRDAPPGRFKIRCPRCHESLAVTVPDGPGVATIVTPMVAARPVVDPDETIEQDTRPSLGPAFPPPEIDETIVEQTRPGSVGFEPAFTVPRWLGGYRVGRLLGATLTGLVHEGRRVATGRPVSLAILRPRWAADASFVARLAREVFAAEQLRHPNLVPAIDFNVARGLPFVASEAGAAPLSDPSRGRAGLDRTARVAAILHAARGLRHAHEQHVFHRDLGLDKIQVDEAGLVRLAGLGMGLTPETPETPAIAPIPLAGPPGSPPPIAPESPSAGAAREDVAALGRALQALIGGQQGDRAVPPGLAAVARRMAGEGSGTRFPDLGAATRAIEAELGVSGPFAPRDEEAAELEAAAREFDEAPLARLRPLLTMAFAGAVALFAALLLIGGRPLPALGFVAFGAMVAGSMVVVRGIFASDPLFDRTRELVLGGSRGDLLTAMAVPVLVVGALFAAHWLMTWVFLAWLAAGLAAAYHFAMERPVAQARAGAIARASHLILGLRRLGVDEADIRRFVCRQAGSRWEEFFEALFGLDARRDARRRWGLDAGGRRRPRFAPWRDPILGAIDAKLDARRRDRDRAILQGIEERGAEARGINLLTARRKSHRVAEAMVALASQYRRSPDGSLGLPLRDALLRATERPEEFLAATAAIEESTGPPAWREAMGVVARVVFGPRTRFLAGGVLLAGCVLWMDQNALISVDETRQALVNAAGDREQAVADAEKLGRKFADNVRGVADAATATKPLEVKALSPAITSRVDGFGLGVAGLILVLSSFFEGARFAAFAVPAALVAAFGPHLIDPGARPLDPTSMMAMAVGGGLFALGVMFGRSRN